MMLFLLLILAAACATLLWRDVAREAQVRDLAAERDEADDNGHHWFTAAQAQARASEAWRQRAFDAEDSIILLTAELERVEDTHERSLSLVVAELDEKRRAKAGRS
jgi:hypothetical protein